jgi:hypothetical protein
MQLEVNELNHTAYIYIYILQVRILSFRMVNIRRPYYKSGANEIVHILFYIQYISG